MKTRDLLFIVLVALAPSVDWAASYYVDPAGNNACNGTSPSLGASGSCAKATVGAMITAIRAADANDECGDTVNIAAGTLVEPATGLISFGLNCDTGGGQFTLQGAGVASTTWLYGLTQITNCSLVSGSIYQCDAPAGWVASIGGGAIIQRILSPVLADDVAPQGNGTKFNMVNWARVTERLTYALIDQDGTFFRCDGVSCPTGKVRIWGWNNETPASTSFYAPTNSSSVASIEFATASHGINFRDLTMVHGHSKGFQVAGDNIAITNVTSYTGEMWNVGTSGCLNSTGSCAAGAEVGLLATNVSILNIYRRCTDSSTSGGGNCAVPKVCSGGVLTGASANFCTSDANCSGIGTCSLFNNDFTLDDQNDWGYGTASWVTQGSNFVFTNVETGGARNGATFTQPSSNGVSCSNGTVNRFIYRGHHNHGFQIGDYCHDLVFTNGQVWAMQEDLFAAQCAFDIVLTNNTFVSDNIAESAAAGTCISGVPAGIPTPPTEGWYNLTFCNNIIVGFGQIVPDGARAGVNFDFYNNLHIQGGNYFEYSPQGDSPDNDCDFATPAAYASWTDTNPLPCPASDPCTNCTRDPGSLSAAGTDTFVDFETDGKDDTAVRDLSLKSTSVAINAGTTNAAHPECQVPTTDYLGNARDASPDIGAYESGTAPPSSTYSSTSRGVKYLGVKVN